MKKFFLPALAALLVTLCGCGESEKPVPVDDRQVFAVGFDAEFPPYAYNSNGEYVGLDLDLAREVAKRNNWKLVLKPIRWDARDAELAAGNINCVWSGFTIDGREDQYEWTSPYADNQQVLMVREASKIRNFGDLVGKKVAVQTETTAQKALSPGGRLEKFAATFGKLVDYPDYPSAIADLGSGKVDAVAIDIATAKLQVATGKFKLLQPILFAEKYGVGFRKGETELCNAVERTLVRMVDDGTAAKISAKYFDGEDVLIIGKPPKF